MYFLLVILLIFLLYLYLSMPSMRKPYLSQFTNIDYAHRGLHDNKGPNPENSFLAIKNACDNSYGMEFDIRLSRDGQIVLFHDDDLKRVCGIAKKVRDLDYKELQGIKLLNSEETLPLFTDVLDYVSGKVPLIVELKCDNKDVSELCSKAAALLDKYEGPYMVESFNPLAMEWFKKNRPSYIRGQLSSGHFDNLSPLNNFLMKNLLVNFMSRPDFIAYEHKYRTKFSLWIQKHIWKKLMVCYTVKKKEDYKINKKYFDLIIFEQFIP